MTILEARERLAVHWPEYLIEAWGLGLFMFMACVCTVALEHPAGFLHPLLPSPVARRAVMGLLMGLTAVGIIYSPWGKRSGAHINPSVTLSFLHLGKIKHLDAFFYIVSQFIGAVVGVELARQLVGALLVDAPQVQDVVTVPGPEGTLGAFAAEFGISFLLMSTVLALSNSKRLSNWTGVGAGTLLATYILFESPLSGTSMNPARSFGSAIFGGHWDAMWLYLVAPVIGMLTAASLYRQLKSHEAVLCAKLHHPHADSCHFHCTHPRTTPFATLKREDWQEVSH